MCMESNIDLMEDSNGDIRWLRYWGIGVLTVLDRVVQLRGLLSDSVRQAVFGSILCVIGIVKT